MNVDKDPSGAVFTEDRRHRLYLWRRWSKEGRWIMFIGLNPSSAAERRNDPTISREIAFADRWGYGGMFKFNAYTFVATDPTKLDSRSIAMGADLAMRVARTMCDMAVVCWGDLIIKVPNYEHRIEWIKERLSPLHCLGITQKGNPRHPLYLRSDTELENYIL